MNNIKTNFQKLYINDKFNSFKLKKHLPIILYISLASKNELNIHKFYKYCAWCSLMNDSQHNMYKFLNVSIMPCCLKLKTQTPLHVKYTHKNLSRTPSKM